MSRFEVVRFSTPSELAKDAAARLLQFAASRERTILGLSGGRITVLLFGELCAQSPCEKGTPPNWAETIEFFWVDERCVPASDPESNFGIAKKQLFDPLHIQSERMHPIRGETDPVFAATAAEAELCRLAPLNPEGVPVIDLLLLGMGEDGHVASLFPGEVVAERFAGSIYRPVVGPKPPPNRITLTFQAIAAARVVWVLVSGEGKQAALQQALAGDQSLPLGQVLSQRNQTLVLTDLKPV